MVEARELWGWEMGGRGAPRACPASACTGPGAAGPRALSTAVWNSLEKGGGGRTCHLEHNAGGKGWHSSQGALGEHCSVVHACRGWGGSQRLHVSKVLHAHHLRSVRMAPGEGWCWGNVLHTAFCPHHMGRYYKGS